MIHSAMDGRNVIKKRGGGIEKGEKRRKKKEEKGKDGTKEEVMVDT